jgi:hypothetical protein
MLNALIENLFFPTLGLINLTECVLGYIPLFINLQNLSFWIKNCWLTPELDLVGGRLNGWVGQTWFNGLLSEVQKYTNFIDGKK